MTAFKELCAELKALKDVYVCAHINPDADAVGSSCGLALGLRQIGIEANVYIPGPIPENLLELSRPAPITSDLPKNKFSTLIVVDTASKKRIAGDYEALIALAGRTINIDHHISNEPWANVNFVQAQSSASAQIVYEILVALGVAFNKDIANLLYAGILDDTGSFRYSNATAEALQSASQLVKLGANPQYVSNNLYFSLPERVLRLRAFTLANLKFVAGGKIGMVTVTTETLKQSNATAEDTEGLIDEVRTIKGTVGAIFIRELEKGWKVSFRSKREDLDVNAIAGVFGGGGHKAASGCTLVGSQSEVENKIIKKVEEAVSKLN